MLLDYFGLPTSRRKIIAELPMIKSGIYIGYLGKYLLERGFHVRLVVYHKYPNFPGNFILLKNNEVNAHTRKWCDEKPNLPLRRSIKEFLSAGGTLTLRPVTEHDIYNALTKKVGVILNICPDIASGEAKIESYGHYVVPIRISKRNMTVNDPAYGKMSYPTKRIMLACHRWSAGALFVSPK